MSEQIPLSAERMSRSVFGGEIRPEDEAVMAPGRPFRASGVVFRRSTFEGKADIGHHVENYSAASRERSSSVIAVSVLTSVGRNSS